ncbi:MAG TPA: hypothetical protein VNJ08_07720 [Bacteriovoracaceae bacterium]|nr:hypothetical protein [Bacteriovoracaceae bacterium]
MNALNKISKEKLLIRACHACLKLNESVQELERCSHCNKSFLPLRYFEKIHNDKDLKWQKHFSTTEDIEEEDLIKGLFVLW